MIFIKSKKHSNFFLMIDTIDIMLWSNTTPTLNKYNMLTAHTVYSFSHFY